MAITFRAVTAPDDDELMLMHELNPGYTVERLPDESPLVVLLDPYRRNVEFGEAVTTRRSAMSGHLIARR
jgi:hypothetical protein